MKIAVPKESAKFEKRVAASPETVKKFVALGFEVSVEKDAGVLSNVTDTMFKDAGATIAKSYADTIKDADVVLKVQIPSVSEAKSLKKGMLLTALMTPQANKKIITDMAKTGVTTCSLELIPRISRAQSMDVLSSQSNLAGYKAVLDATEVFERAIPMMMTAAGTIPPARVLVLGAGVAGLQAIATAKRLGAVVSAFDVRPAAKEQVESLGASFVQVEDENADSNDTVYAKEMTEDYKKRQAQKIHDTLKKSDIAICTALIPGKPAPRLITKPMIKDMKQGAVIVDMAVESGGNAELSKVNEIVEHEGVKILGHPNMASRVAEDASRLFAKNLLNLLTPLFTMENGKATAINLNFDDEIVKGCVLTHDGEIVHDLLKA